MAQKTAAEIAINSLPCHTVLSKFVKSTSSDDFKTDIPHLSHDDQQYNALLRHLINQFKKYITISTITIIIGTHFNKFPMRCKKKRLGNTICST